MPPTRRRSRRPACRRPTGRGEIGIVSGHRGPENDPGAVCPDGLTEASVNLSVATLVVRNLRGLGYTVDLLDEFDPRLQNYQAAALVSIHANTCQDFGERCLRLSGFGGAGAHLGARRRRSSWSTVSPRHYAAATQLERRTETNRRHDRLPHFPRDSPADARRDHRTGLSAAPTVICSRSTRIRWRAGSPTEFCCFLEPGQ